MVMLHIKLKGMEHREPDKHILSPYTPFNLWVGLKGKKNLTMVLLHIKGPRTVLIRVSHKNGQRKVSKKMICFFMKKIVGSTLDLSTKAVFSLDKYQLKNMG